MTELVVAFICFAGTSSCGEATTAYYDYNTDIQRWAKTVQNSAERKYGKQNLAVIGTFIGAGVVRKGTVNLYSHTNLVLDENSVQIQLHWDQ